MEARLLEELQRVTTLAENLVEHIHNQSAHPENNEVIMFDVDAIQYAKAVINRALEEVNKVIDTIKIEKYEDGGFNVIQGDKYSEHLGYDEMLGLVSALTIPDSRPCLQWMRTKKQHETLQSCFSPKTPELEPWQKLLEAPTDVKFEDILVPDEIEIYTLRDDIMNINDWGDSLFIGFGSNQTLGYNSVNGSYSISSTKSFRKVQCKLIPCNRDEFKVGDTAFADLLGNTGNNTSYCKVLDGDKIVYPTSDHGASITEWKGFNMQWFKVILA